MGMSVEGPLDPCSKVHQPRFTRAFTLGLTFRAREYLPCALTDSRISPPMHTKVLMISARVARECAKMHLRNMGCAWSSSIVSTCFLSLCACVSEPHGSQPKIEVPRRTLALPPVRRPDAPRDVGRSEARTLLSTAHTLANLSPNLVFEWHQQAPRSGVGVLGWKVCDARSEKRRVARVGDSAHLFGSIELTFVHDRPVLVVGDVRRQNGAPQWAILTRLGRVVTSRRACWESARRTSR